MIRNGRLRVLVMLAIACGALPAQAQTRQDAALRDEVERRFDVLPLRDGIALHPKAAGAPVRSIEITGDTIALDGQPATGAELRSRLGDDAGTVLRLSYLTDAERRTLFGMAPVAPASQPAAPAAPSVAPPPPPPEPSSPPGPPRRSRERRSGDRVRILGGGVNVDADETIDGDVVAVGGPVRVDGEVRGEVVAVGGDVTLGPQSRVEGDVIAVGGRLRRDPGAEVGGRAQEIAIGGIEFDRWSWRHNPVGEWWGDMVGSAFAFVGTLARVAVLCLLAALVVLFGREYMERAGAVASRESLKAGAVGLLAQVLFVPLLVVTIVVMVVTIVGIPLLLLLPFVLLALVAFGVVGFTAVCNRVGVIAATRFGWSQDNPYFVTIVGVLVLMLPVILSRLVGMGGGVLFPMTMVLSILGLLIEYLAWTVGIGAIALARFNRRYEAPVLP